jgi:hypothetical protein
MLQPRTAAVFGPYLLADVDAVIVDGRVLIADNRYLHGDEAAITAAGAAAIQKIWDLPEARAAFAE